MSVLVQVSRLKERAVDGVSDMECRASLAADSEDTTTRLPSSEGATGAQDQFVTAVMHKPLYPSLESRLSSGWWH